MSIVSLRELVDTFCTGIANLSEIIDFDTDLDISTMARVEICAFMLYLSASDGCVSQDEAETINEACGASLSLDDMVSSIKKHKLTNLSVPMTFRYLVQADNVMRSNNEDSNFAKTFISMCETIGQVLIVSDGAIYIDEKIKLTAYLVMLQEYYIENSNAI